MNEKRRGGKRPGAGRPKSTGADDPDFRKVAVTVRLSAWVAACLRQRKAQGPLVEEALIRRYGWTPPREAQENISQPAPGTAHNRREDMAKMRYENLGECSAVMVDGVTDAYFTINHEFGVWGCGPEDNATTFERLAEAAGMACTDEELNEIGGEELREAIALAKSAKEINDSIQRAGA